MSKSDKLMGRFGANIAQTVGMRPGSTPMPAAEQGPDDKYAGAVRSRAFAELPVDAVVANAQPRETFDADELHRLAASIKRFGQLAPIRVRRDEGRGAWVVLVGERRLRACRLAGLERVRVELVERELTEADVLAEQVVENAVRADLQPVEQARAYRRLMEMHGWTAQELAETLSVEPTGVYRALGLLRLPDDVADRVDAGEIRATAAYEISKLQIADDARAVAAAVASGALDHAGTVAEVNRRRSASKSSKGRSRGGKTRKVTSRTIRTDGGVKITLDCRKHLDDALVLEALEQAVSEVRAKMDRGREQAA